MITDSAPVAPNPVTSAAEAIRPGFGLTPLQIDRTARIRALRAELSLLLEEEAQEACANLKDVKRDCIALFKAGRHVDAIKMLRHHTGLSLREAKDLLEGSS